MGGFFCTLFVLAAGLKLEISKMLSLKRIALLKIKGVQFFLGYINTLAMNYPSQNLHLQN